MSSARRGHSLVLVARRKPKLDELAAELTDAFGVRAVGLGCDLSKAASLQRLPARIAVTRAARSVLVNNAGFATGGPFAESDPERELEQVRVLVEAPVALSSAFIPGMVGRGAGAVLNVASTAGMQPMPYSAGYSAAKAYVLDLLRGAASRAARRRRDRHRAGPGTGLDRVLGRRRLGGRLRRLVRVGDPPPTLGHRRGDRPRGRRAASSAASGS